MGEIVKEMFSDAENSGERTSRFERYKAELAKSLANPIPLRQERSPEGQPVYRKITAPESSTSVLQRALASGELSKSISADTVASLQEQLAQADLAKTSPTSDWTIGSPTNLYAYDLEAGAKILVPFYTPLRNRIPRLKGEGTAHEFRVINGFSGSGTGGLGLVSPAVSESTSNTFGPGSLGLARGPKIQVSGYSVSVPYQAFGMSTDVSWEQQFAGIGFDDTRQLAQNGLLWSSMLAEEHMLLGARGTKTGFAGALAGPTVTAAARTANATVAGYTTGPGEVGASGTIVTLYVAVTSVGHWGESVPTLVTIGSSAVVSGDVVDLTIADVQGAFGYHVYAGTSNSTGAGSGTQTGATVYTGLFPAQVSGPVGAPGITGPQSGTKTGKLTVNFTGAGTDGVPNAGLNPVTTDTTANAGHYDGLVTWCTGANAGYVNRVNNTFVGNDGANVGNTFSAAFSAMWAANKASPDEILGSGADCKQVSDQLKVAGGSDGPYEIILSQQDVGGATVGSIVNAIWNPVCRRKVALNVHPWLDQGTMPIITWTMNLPNTNISDVWEVRNVQDYLGIQWPQIQYLYEESSYWQGTFYSKAPSYCGAIQGIWAA